MITLRAGERELVLNPAQQAVIRRDPGCDNWFDTPGVSRRHATVRHDGTAWWLVDDSTMNGTFVNGQQIRTHRITGAVTAQIGDGGDRVTLVTTEDADPWPSAAVEDLGSSNRTYLNGQQAGRARRAEGDVLTLGDESYALRFASPVKVAIGDGAALSADLLTFELANGQRLLDEISFMVGPGVCRRSSACRVRARRPS